MAGHTSKPSTLEAKQEDYGTKANLGYVALLSLQACLKKEKRDNKENLAP